MLLLRIKITREKPSGCISGVQNQLDGVIEYSERLPDTCQLSKYKFCFNKVKNFLIYFLKKFARFISSNARWFNGKQLRLNVVI